MEYNNLVKDFARRTLKNIEVLHDIQESKHDAEIYEVTQLINSMLGLLVFPHEKYIKKIPKTPLNELANHGWPLPEIIGQYKQPEHLNELVTFLRNAVAHFNLEFLSDSNSQITGVTFWNKWKDQETWRANLSIKDLKLITRKLIDIID